MDELAKANFEKEKKLYNENKNKKTYSNMININTNELNENNCKKDKNFLFPPLQNFYDLFNKEEIEFLKNLFMNYSSDEVK